MRVCGSLPGSAALHVHHDVDDSIYLLRGQLAMRCGVVIFVANAGDNVSLPKGVPHALSNVGDQEAVLLQTHDAGSFLTFIRSVGISADQPQPDPASLDDAAMNKVAGQTGQPVLGPPMSGEEARAILARGRSQQSPGELVTPDTAYHQVSCALSWPCLAPTGDA
jgi:hypothetical protein